MKPELGKSAPAVNGRAFWLGRDGAETLTFALQDFRGKKIVLAFYPGDFTPVCTTEMCDFTDNIGALGKLNALVVGISIDPLDKHEAFARKYNLAFPLIDDSTKSIADAYGVSGNFLSPKHKRAIFVIDESGKLVWKKIELATLFRTEVKKIAKVLEAL